MAKVVIIGGGVAGLTAAHELIERGFAVEVYELNRLYVGGKARSVDFLPSDGAGTLPLPGEHGFRFFPSFYTHIYDTLKRIPFTHENGTVNSNGCFDNLIALDKIMFARDNKKPIITSARFPRTLGALRQSIQTASGAGGSDTGLTEEEATFFKDKIWQLFTSGTKRFAGEYEQLGWWYYLECDRFSPIFQDLLANGLSRSLVAAKAKEMSTRVGGQIFLQLLMGMMDPAGSADYVLNGPTNDKWLTPWRNHLESLGVTFFINNPVIKIESQGYKVTNIHVKDDINNSILQVTGDYYVLAVPVERASDLLNADLISKDPTLGFPHDLKADVSWMNGIQFYLNRDVPVLAGHIIHINSKWAITSISQKQFWTHYPIEQKYNGNVKGILSVDISDWLEGEYNGRTANNCTESEIARLTWEQMYNSLRDENNMPLLPQNMDDIVETWYLDRAIHDIPWLGTTNQEPLLVNKVNRWDIMPKSWCKIENLFLAGDYTRTNTGLATMEAANESARRAANCIIAANGGNSSYAKIWKLKRMITFMPHRWYDNKRYEKGLPYTSKLPLALNIFAIVWAVICLHLWAIIHIVPLLRNYFRNRN